MIKGFDCGGYGDLMNMVYVDHFEELPKSQIKHDLKILWSRNPVAYEEWKEWCREEKKLSHIFGTLDNPIDIDESKL